MRHLNFMIFKITLYMLAPISWIVSFFQGGFREANSTFSDVVSIGKHAEFYYNLDLSDGITEWWEWREKHKESREYFTDLNTLNLYVSFFTIGEDFFSPIKRKKKAKNPYFYDKYKKEREQSL